MLARSAEQRLRARTVPNAAMISAGATLAWLVLVALPVTLASGLHLGALLAGVGVGALLFGVILLLGQRQIRLVKQSEQRNQRVADAWAGTDDGIS
jgi:membrane protein implicated in regulation of membrane protease activity